MFEAAGLNPTVINGGIINNKLTNAYVGTGDYLIAEADESDSSFIRIPSTIGAITNIDKEHMDHYKDFGSLVGAFKSFLLNLPFYGFGVVCIDDPVVRSIITDIKTRKIITYGIDSQDANVIAYNIQSNITSSTFDVKIDIPSTGRAIIENITIPTPGKHNVLNALVAVAMAIELDFGIKIIRDGFRSFKGVKRRFTLVEIVNGVEIIDDYAHHPAEIVATVATASSIAKKRQAKVVAVFQPHRYSRLSSLFSEFVHAFRDVDLLYITDIYSAGEDNIYNVSVHQLIEDIAKTGKKVNYLPSFNELPSVFNKECGQGDIMLIMGAGNITNWSYALPAEIQKNN
jgi:UDP-N-acetylmuramate--alanine ligase